MRWLKIVIAMLILTFANALIKDSSIKIERRGVTLIDAFSFGKGGSYAFQIISSDPIRRPEILLMLVDKGDNCDSIGKTCTYKAFKITNICTDIAARTLDAAIPNIYPVLINSLSYNATYNYSVEKFISKPWATYWPATSFSVKEHVDKFILPAIASTMLLDISDTPGGSYYYPYNGSEKSPFNFVKQIITNISGVINETKHAYFAIVSCANETVKLDVKYTFLNSEGEQLPLTEIPYKVFPCAL